MTIAPKHGSREPKNHHDGHLDDVFGTGGLLSAQIADYKPRTGQLKMAQAVQTALTDANHLLVEAPTGVGKTLAYCVPAIRYAVSHKKRIVIVTANIALQDQLVGKDLPFLQKDLKQEFLFALLKGRSNYLCLDRLAQNVAPTQQKSLDLDESALSDEKALSLIHQWAQSTQSGDWSELKWNPSGSVRERCSVSADECKGRDCARYRDCFHTQAAKQAEKAQIVVVNYHLFFAHLQIRHQSGAQWLLPEYDAVIMDEAHQAADIARDFFGTRIGQRGLRQATRLLSQCDEGSLQQTVAELGDKLFKALKTHFNSQDYRNRLKQTDVAPYRELCQALQKAAQVFEEASKHTGLGGTQALPSDGVPTTTQLESAKRRCEKLAAEIQSAMELSDTNAVVYLESNAKQDAVRLCAKAIEVAPLLKASLFDRVPSVIMTSATLTTPATSEPFGYIQNELGAHQAQTLVVPSPFDLAVQAKLLVAKHMPPPNDEQFSTQVADSVQEIAKHCQGRTLALFTSKRNMQITRDCLRPHSDLNVLCQGERPTGQLINCFSNGEGRQYVLLGTESFWTGIDIPGPALLCVVIDRLPFPRLSEPLMDWYSENVKDCFLSHSLPRAIIGFRQGFGRLIRSTGDRGIVVVLDKRLITKPYGRHFCAHFPLKPIPLTNLDHIANFIKNVEARL